MLSMSLISIEIFCRFRSFSSTKPIFFGFWEVLECSIVWWWWKHREEMVIHVKFVRFFWKEIIILGLTIDTISITSQTCYNSCIFQNAVNEVMEKAFQYRTFSILRLKSKEEAQIFGCSHYNLTAERAISIQEQIPKKICLYCVTLGPSQQTSGFNILRSTELLHFSLFVGFLSNIFIHHSSVLLHPSTLRLLLRLYVYLSLRLLVSAYFICTVGDIITFCWS